MIGEIQALELIIDGISDYIGSFLRKHITAVKMTKKTEQELKDLFKVVFLFFFTTLILWATYKNVIPKFWADVPPLNFWQVLGVTLTINVFNPFVNLMKKNTKISIDKNTQDIGVDEVSQALEKMNDKELSLILYRLKKKVVNEIKKESEETC